MPIIAWTEELSVKIKEIDDQHRQLVKMINTMHDAMKERKGKEIISAIIDEMVAYTHKHFTTEERLFLTHNYPETTKHTREHNAFVEKVAKFQTELKAGRVTLTLDVMSFLKDWLVNHIKGTDKRYTAFLNAKGVL